MKIILLSGGSGKRLWPLSNGVRAKQFLKLLRNSHSEPESMLQRVWRQLTKAGLEDSTYIATSKSQAEYIESQISQKVPLIVEPASKDTFPAIALACSYLFSEEQVELDEVICVLPVDPYVEDTFFDTIKTLESIITNQRKSVALIGTKPTYPAEKYGYIIPSNKKSPPYPFLSVHQFIEKPDKAQSQHLITEKGALWNCGVFAFRLNFVISYLVKKGWPTDFHSFVRQYDQYPSRSFDYELLHQNQRDDMVVVPYDGDWKDLGTWNTLTEEIDPGSYGKGRICEESKNTHLINELDLPVLVLGLSNVIVASSPDGILVSDKSASPRLKEYLQTQDKRPMYEERRWGWYQVLDFMRNKDGEEVLTKKLVIHAGKNLSYQFHQNRRENWMIVSGEGVFVLNGKFIHVKPGDVLHISQGAKHAVKAVTDLTIIEVQIGGELVEEDIVRLRMSWEEIETL